MRVVALFEASCGNQSATGPVRLLELYITLEVAG